MVICRGEHVLKNPTTRGAGRVPRPRRRPRLERVVRDVVDRRRRPGRARRGGLRRVRGARRPGARERRRPAARPGRARGSRTTWAFRPASPARRWPGARSRRPRSSAPRSRSARTRRCGWTATAAPTGSDLADGQERARARRSSSPPACSTGSSSCRTLARFEGAGRLLQRDVPRGAALRRRGGHRRRRRQLGRAGGASSCRSSPTHVHVLVRGPGSPTSMSRYLIRRIEDDAEHHAAHTRHGHRALDGERPPGER